MSILITGGAGFIGGNFALDWGCESGELLINIDKLSYAGNLQTLERIKSDVRHIFIKGDIGDSSLVEYLLLKYSPRAVINFAAESHVDRSIHGPDEFIQSNILSTYRLLETVRRYWNKMPAELKSKFRFLQVSTDEVYGSLNKDQPAFTESHRYEPNSPYSASKAAGDHLVRAWHQTYGIPVLTTNCSNNYGPYQFPEKLIPLMVVNALSNKTLPIYGDGLQVRDWLYVKDHCKAIKRVLDRGEIGATYNVGGRNEMCNIKIVQTVCSLLDEMRPRTDGAKYASQISFVADRPGHDRRYAVDARKIERDLGWKPIETFESGIRKTVSWYLENAEWVANVQSGRYREWGLTNALSGCDTEA
jgi:dTDP-glucose 4,6-dehydratase